MFYGLSNKKLHHLFLPLLKQVMGSLWNGDVACFLKNVSLQPK